MSQPETDVYSNTGEEWYPGIRERSRPGQGPQEEVFDRVRDVHGNLVSDKPANRTMMAAQRRRLEHEARVRADKERRATDPSPRSTIWSLLPLFLFLPLLSSFLTQSYTFNLSPYFVPQLRRFWAESTLNPFRQEMRVLTPVQLAMYDGADDQPVYLAIDGVVYDVTANRRVYGKGGSYNMILSEAEQASLAHWKSFFANHEKYHKVGTVLNPPIDPRSPIPPPCRVENPNTASDTPHAPGEAAAKRGKEPPGPVHST
ncbi:hypothetical protein IAR55_006576 [Kwoniella newhampshirensis]|uniref:Cytochrome b5 heme-binding domain-containing protein n=1 Tax=Kwoniella newhampshirensis TaxID=1651941 RepID=A0AAW0YU56_9TREE